MKLLSKVRNALRYRLSRLIRRGPAGWYHASDEEEKYRHLLEAVNYLRVAQLPPTFFEFGCHSARTFSATLRAARHLGVDLDAYAFDSFQGLPETDPEEDGYFQTGTFATSRDAFERRVRRLAGVRLRPEQIIEGFYEDSLVGAAVERVPDEVGMVHIDVDLYSSARSVLEFIHPKLVDGTVILFDDWYAFPPGENKGERRATEEFLREHPEITLERWKPYSGFGLSFFVIKR